MAQCFGNEEDLATKGRQMPVGMSFIFLNVHMLFHIIPAIVPKTPFLTILRRSPPIPQAAGVGYASSETLSSRKICAVVYFGEGGVRRYAKLIHKSSDTLFIAGIMALHDFYTSFTKYPQHNSSLDGRSRLMA